MVRGVGISSPQAPEMRNGPFRCLEIAKSLSCLQHGPQAGDAGYWQQVSAVSAAEDCRFGYRKVFPSFALAW